MVKIIEVRGNTIIVEQNGQFLERPIITIEEQEKGVIDRMKRLSK